MRRDGPGGRSGNWEAAVSLAMLPVGVGLGVASALASVGLLMGALFLTAAAALFGPFWPWLPVLLWLWIAGIVAAWCAVTAVEATGALDWRVGARVAAAWGLVALAWPGTWLG